MTTDTLTAAELHRIFNAPWCPKCGLVCLRPAPQLDGHENQPGLWARCPETRPDGLADCAFEDTMSDPADLEERILGRLVKVAPTKVVLEALSAWQRREHPTKVHAAVCEYHRWKDSIQDV